MPHAGRTEFVEATNPISAGIHETVTTANGAAALFSGTCILLLSHCCS